MADAPQKSIGGRTYSFGTMSATDAVRVEVAIAKVIGEPLFKAFTAGTDGKGKPLTKEDEEAAAMGAVSTIAQKMDADELLKTMETVFRSVSCDGQFIQIDATFTGRPKDLWLVLVEALKANFAGFFPAGLLSSIAAKLPAAPTT